MNPHPLALLSSLFAQATPPGSHMPSWTDKEVLFAIGSVIATMLTVGVSVVFFLVRLVRSNDRNKTRKAEAECQRLRTTVIKLQQDLQNLTEGAASEKENLGEMRAQMDQARREVEQLLLRKAATEDQAASQRQAAEHLEASLEEMQAKLAEHQGAMEAQRRRIDKALRKDGQTWTEKVLHNAPEFKPLEPGKRRTPIIAVLNLKGGVGKTTVTANLGAALDGMGYRVLMLDLDLQGSLTGLFLPESRQQELFNAERLMGDFLALSFGAEYPNLLDFTQAILPDGKSGLVPTTDQLAYAETNLTIRWLLREANRDPRFLLRRELHLRRITGQFDIVLLDCPPLINMCCVNALAASDYLLVPILPSKQATDRVPVLLKRLKSFRENINPELHVLGILPNRTHRLELTLDEQNRLTHLSGQCKDSWGFEVPLFDTFIRQNAEVRAAEDGHRPLLKEDTMYQTFVELAGEVESRLPTFCRPATDAATREAVS
jgi:cellulose biosynthesis protein BcsQ